MHECTLSRKSNTVLYLNIVFMKHVYIVLLLLSLIAAIKNLNEKYFFILIVHCFRFSTPTETQKFKFSTDLK